MTQVIECRAARASTCHCASDWPVLPPGASAAFSREALVISSLLGVPSSAGSGAFVGLSGTSGGCCGAGPVGLVGGYRQHAFKHLLCHATGKEILQ